MLPVICTLPQGCAGVVYVDPAPAVRGRGRGRGRVRAHMARRGRFGRSPFTVGAGQTAQVRVRLSTSARRALGMPGRRGRARSARRGRNVRAQVTLVVRGRRPQRANVTLRG
jgi:hypothetical protein